jgi:RNA polymerase sigma-70 factor (family 1)
MITDFVLWASIKRGDETAFSELFHRYSPRIYNKAFFKIKDTEVCTQIVHDIFLTLWNNRKTLEINSFIGYFTSATRYQVYRYTLRQKSTLIDYKEDLSSLSNTFTENKGYSSVAYQDLELELESYLQNLPKRCREIFLMSRQKSLSNDEIAGALGISRRSVENQITYALKQLRVSLKDISVLLIILYGL